MSKQAIENIAQAVYTAREICGSRFWNAQPCWIAEAGFVLVMINLKDALQALNGLNKRISFADDVQIEGDITDLIREMRNTCCHIQSKNRDIDLAKDNSVHFSTLIGAGILIKTPEVELSSPYPDDVAFFYGSLRIFLHRHICRAIEEARANTIAIADEAGVWIPHLR